MGNYRPMSKAQRAVFEDVFSSLPLLDDEFDGEMDFADKHSLDLELSGQFTTYNQN